jgi:hypothetical protein
MAQLVKIIAKKNKTLVNMLLMSSVMLTFNCIGCFEKYWFQNKSGKEILIVDGILTDDQSQIEFSFLTCEDKKDNSNCLDIVPNSILLFPYFEDISDSLKFITKKEGLIVFELPDKILKDKMNLRMLYQVDSAGFIINRELNIVLHKEKQCRFTVH